MDEGELTMLRQRLARAEKLAIAAELSAVMAHEIKNPLAPIRGYAQLLSTKLDRVDPADRELFSRALAVIREEVERIDRRVTKLLERMHAHKTERAPAAIDLVQAVNDAIRLAEGTPNAPPIVSAIPKDPIEVLGDEDDVRGAMLNVLENAIEAMAGAAGVIEVRIRREGEQAVVEVLDEGPGIDPEAAARAFESFFTTKAAGTGLGLAVVKAAVEAGGGEATIAPRPDRRGTRVQMRFVTAR
jgi:signal transduction histidine kinase